MSKKRPEGEAPPPSGASGQGAPFGYPDFEGKAVVLFCAGRDIDYPIVLTHAHFEVQAGRTFLVGMTPESQDGTGWTDGVRRGVAWDSVDNYLVFDSLADYFARLDRDDEELDEAEWEDDEGTEGQ